VEATKMKACIKCSLIVTAFWAFCLWGYLYRAYEVSGDELKTIVERSSFKSYGSWFLYLEDGDRYCVKSSRPIVPQRYCVPKTDIEIRNSNGGGSKIGAIYEDEWVLKENRYQGARMSGF
jgi:hypothetical protein